MFCIIAHAQNFRGAFEVEKYRTALEEYSNCTLAAFFLYSLYAYSIPHIRPVGHFLQKKTFSISFPAYGPAL